MKFPTEFLISTGMYSGKGVVWHYMGRYAESFFPCYDHYIQPWVALGGIWKSKQRALRKVLILLVYLFFKCHESKKKSVAFFLAM